MTGRWRSPEEAAAYLGVRIDQLPRLRKAGRLPAPSYALGPRTPRYDRLLLDSSLTGASPSSSTQNVQDAVEAACQVITNEKPRTQNRSLSARDGSVKVYTDDRRPKQRRERYLRDSVGALLVAFKQSPEWQALAPITRCNYALYIRDLQLLVNVAVRDIRRRDILQIRDAIVRRSGPAAANFFVKVCSTLFRWAVQREWIEFSPVANIERLPGNHLPSWRDEQAEQAMQVLPEELRRVVLLAMFTGQRRGDLCAMRWSAFDGNYITVKQQKTGVTLRVPVHARLREELFAWKREATSTHILTNAQGRPWSPAYLSHRLPEMLQQHGFPSGLNVHGLRKLAAVMLAEAGCSVHEIAAITGHRSLAMVALYTANVEQKRLADAAVERLSLRRGDKTDKRGLTN
jgi:integrase